MRKTRGTVGAKWYTGWSWCLGQVLAGQGSNRIQRLVPGWAMHFFLLTQEVPRVQPLTSLSHPIASKHPGSTLSFSF